MGSLHLGVLFILGIGVFGGILGGLLFQKLNAPQVIGYIVIGLVIGRSGLRVIDADTLEAFQLFNVFALGIIGFLVGGELFMGTIKKYARQFAGILVGEGILSFVLVSAFVFLIMYLLTGRPVQAAAVGLVFGSVSAATDPASTLDVLWENRAAGILTTTIVAIVALDDALAMGLYGIGSGISRILLGGPASLGREMLAVAVQIPGAVILGIAGGLILNWVLHSGVTRERVVAFAIGVILIIISAAQMLEMDIIFASMAMGLMVRNMAPDRSRKLFELVRSFSIPIYVFFFVLVGARLSITAMPWWMWAVAGVYFAGRNGGKLAGAWLGAKLTRADPAVRRYTGLGLSAQGGVTIGLAVIAGQRLAGVYLPEGVSVGDMVVFIITATTLMFQLTGPPLVKLAVKLSGESGRNLTRDDLIARRTVEEMAWAPVVTLGAGDPVSRIVDVFSANDYLVYPVTGPGGGFMGVISFENLKDVLTDQDMWEWVVAQDLAARQQATLQRDMPLKDALDIMDQTGVEQLPVLDGGGQPVALLDRRSTIRLIDREILALQGTP